MSDYLLIETADKVMYQLNSASGPVSCDISRRYPDFDLELETHYTQSAQVSIIPAGMKTLDYTSRNRLKLLCSVDIITQYRFGFVDRDKDTGGTEVYSLDDLVSQTERFLMYLCEHRRLGNSDSFDAWLEEAEARTLTDPKHIRQKQFTSQIRAHYAVSKAIPDHS